MTETGPAVYTIPPGVAFVDALARGLYDQAGGEPLELARMTVLLPTRRACRALHEAFLRLSEGRPLLLPRLLPLGDVDAEELLLGDEAAFAASGLDAGLPPPLPETRRQLLLARLIRQWGESDPTQPAPTVDRAARLAAELGRLLDQVETEGLSFDRLKTLVPEEHAEHWQQTLKFLGILTEAWPAIEAESGGMSAAARRRRLLEAQAQAWRAAPPRDPVVAAGSTGSIPATARLLSVVARLPRGAVVLPGLDTEADEAAWAAMGEDPAHPQHTMARLLTVLGVAREDVAVWPAAPARPTPPTRGRLIGQALRPAVATSEWRGLADVAEAQRVELALREVSRLDCPGPGEEATAIALMLRQALEVPGRTAALVTPDRGLARRVAAELQRWHIAVDDSAGLPLRDTAPGTFLRLTAGMLAEGLAPLALLAALKHPLAAGGEDPGAFRRKVRRLEVAVLRGPRPPAGFDSLLAELKDKPGEKTLRPWLSRLRDLAAEAEALLTGDEVAFGKAAEAHLRFAEALAASDGEPGPARLWAGEAGEAAAAFAAELTAHADAAPAIDGGAYPGLLDSLMEGQVVRPRFGGHPRLQILGVQEARLQHADLMVLGGLNEGTWPAETDPGPWLSRPMRRDFGLPPVERRIGLMAHDFAQAFNAPRVVLTRATRVEGAPTVPSRWLLRLEAVLSALGLEPLLVDEQPWLAWAARLDQPARLAPTEAPAPRPPYHARPRELSVTRIETWRRDPYALYAEKILGLKALDPIDQDPGAAEQGTLIHQVLEAFVQAWPETLPEDPEAELLRIGEARFDELRVRPGVRAFWWPRFRRIARWLAAQERARRAEGRRVLAERRGKMTVEAGRDPFTLTAKADRIEQLPDGTLAIVDYKTGTVPSPKAVKLGFAPQLPLEAAIAERGCFEGVPGGQVAELAYWRLTGGPEPGEIKPIKADPGELVDQALAGLERLIEAFDDEATPYMARPLPNWAPRYSDYGHLARIQEWSAGPGGEEDA